MIEPSICGGDAALSIYFDHLFYILTKDPMIKNRLEWLSIDLVFNF